MLYSIYLPLPKHYTNRWVAKKTKVIGQIVLRVCVPACASTCLLVPACASTCDCVCLRVPACACVCLGVCASVQQCVCALACVTFVTRRISLKLRECTPPPALVVCTQFKSSHCLCMLFLIKSSRCLVHCVFIHILNLFFTFQFQLRENIYLFL